MRKICASIMVVLVVMAFPLAGQTGEIKKVDFGPTGTNINIRSKPNIKWGEIIRTISDSEHYYDEGLVEVTGRKRNGWVEIRHPATGRTCGYSLFYEWECTKQVEGWILGDFVGENTDAA